MEWCHVNFIRDSYITFIRRVIGPSKNSMELYFNTKFDFKSTWNRDWATYHHTHSVCQSPAGDTVKLTMFGQDVLERIGLLTTGTSVLGSCDVKGKIISINNSKNCLWTDNVYFFDPQNYLHIMRTFLNYIQNETLNEIKTSLENLWQRTMRLSDFFQHPLVLIPKRKCLVGAGRIGEGRVVLFQLLIYARWSSRHDGLGCHAPMQCTKLRQ